MFLKSLTLKGFKSFADKTTLEFEPGVCVVVGPNGSGKSNVVDSVAWVLGAQGARALRGAKMDDVIFAGTADRPALGRAEVSLTIDNTAGLLPIEFSEVTITRTLFRTGDSEYMINGAPCRLLDIQELLSDTGIGRQQHVIVGQGQLDAVLNARPEERRAIIEEAAGILKFRKRREKAQRRLEATEGNLLRLTDLLREVRRGLRPLERQADAARRHDGLVEELEDDQPAPRRARDRRRCGPASERRRAQRGELAGAGTGRAGPAPRRSTATCSTPSARSRSPATTTSPTCSRGPRRCANGAAGSPTSSPSGTAGFERELAAVADEGVVETLVAEAASLREQLAAVDADFVSLAPTRAEVEAAERRVAELAAAASPADAESRRTTTRNGISHSSSSARPRVASELAQAREQLAAVARELVRAGAGDGRGASRRRRSRTRARAELDAHAQVAPEMTLEAQERRAAEEQLHEADARCARRRSRRDALAGARRHAARRRSTPRTRPRAATRSSAGSTASSARSSTTSRSKPARRSRSPPRSATRSTRSSSRAITSRGARSNA